MDKEKYLKFNARKELGKSYWSTFSSSLQDKQQDSDRIRPTIVISMCVYLCAAHKCAFIGNINISAVKTKQFPLLP